MTPRSQNGNPSRSGRHTRLSEALKANLGRRKQQQRERAAAAVIETDAVEAADLCNDADPIDRQVVGNTDPEESG